MTEILAVTEKPKYTNEILRRATDRVFRIGETVRKCAYETAAIMAKVEHLECYKDDGFNNVHEWAMQTFGFKKSTSYTLLRIGNEYTRAVEHGKTTQYESNLLPEESTLDFTTSQIEKMLPAGREIAVELVESEVITPMMSCKAIEKAIKARMTPMADEEAAENDEGDEEAAENDEGESTNDNVLIRVIDCDGNEYDIPEEVLNKYKV